MRNRTSAPNTPPEDRSHGIPGLLEKPAPWMTRKLVSLLSSRVRIDDEIVERIGELARIGPVVYALKFRSRFDLHFLRTRCAALGLPEPAFVFGTASPAAGLVSRAWRWARLRLSGRLPVNGFDLDAYEQTLKGIFSRGGGAVLFLVDEKTSRERYVHPERDPLSILLEIQGRYMGSIAVVPLVVLYDRNPRRTISPFWEGFLGDPDRPGPLKRTLMARRKWALPEVLMGDPVHLLAEFEEFGAQTTWEELPFRLREELIASVDARIRVSRGPSVRSRTEIKELVLQDEGVQAAVRKIVSEERTHEESVRKAAESYVDEIAADQRFQMHHFLYYVLKWIFARVFSGIDLLDSDFADLKRANAHGSLIFVSSHKSHFDYLLIGWLSFVNQMAIPYMAAGKNLSFWPVGPILRHTAAFFLRRSFKGMELYAQVFAAYLKVLVEQRANINFYIEGGRSRTGKLLPPRLGMLNFLVHNAQEEGAEGLLFVPTFIGYDQVPEENSYLRELAGREKRQESFRSFLQSRKILSRSFGKVYIRFGEPTTLQDFERLRRERAGRDGDPGRAGRTLVEDFAYHLMYGIVRASVVSPIELTAAGLVGPGLSVVPHPVLTEAITCFFRVIERRGGAFAESLQRLSHVVETTLGLFTARGFVEVDSEGGEVRYRINDHRRAHLEFYANGLLNRLWPASLLASVVLAHKGAVGFTDAMRADFHLLRDILATEIIVDPVEDQDEVVDEEFRSFVELGWVSPERVPTESVGLDCCAGAMTHLLFVYYFTLVVAESATLGASRKDFIKTMTAAAPSWVGTDAARPVPSCPSVVVQSALSRFVEMGIVDYDVQRGAFRSVLDPQALTRLRRFLARMLAGRISGPDASF